MLCFTIDILFAIHGLSLSLSLSGSQRFVEVLSTLVCICGEHRHLGVCDAGRLQNVSTIPFSLSTCFFSSISHFRRYHPQWLLYFCYYSFFLASFRVFSLPLAYPFVLLHCRFMLSVMAENHFLHEAWNGGIQIKWFISVEKLSQRNTPTRWLFLFLQKHKLAPKRILYIIGMASIQSAMWKWAKLFATFSIIL